MNVNEINDYLQQAREIIGERSPAEVAYDDSVVSFLSSGMDIKRAIQAANRKHPQEALAPGSDQWDDVSSRYDYIAEHKAILKKLGVKE